jgi:hypothetical protein
VKVITSSKERAFDPDPEMPLQPQPVHAATGSAALEVANDAGKASATRNVLLTTPVPDQKTAWTKARMDVMQQLRGEGYEVLELPASVSAGAGEWLRLFRRMREVLNGAGHVLIEYPFEQRKRTYLVALMSLLSGAKLYALIHDLNSLRYADAQPSRELRILKLFDGVVSHNPAMTRWLRKKGYRGRVADLDLFDYRSNPGQTWHETQMGPTLKVLTAGNMSIAKAAYIYDPRLAQLPNVEMSLYGSFFEPDRAPALAANYKGTFDPDAPVLDGLHHFGLVWDGEGVDTCSGAYGEYMRYNNPHKLSLYVSMGLPVIVWKHSAIAQVVKRWEIGVTVEDLRELSQLPSRITTEEYRQMVANVLPLRDAVSRGTFLRLALRRLTR